MEQFFQNVVPPIGGIQNPGMQMGLMSSNTMSDQNPDAYLVGVKNIVIGMLQKLLSITNLTEYQIFELEWILIRDLFMLRNQFTRFFFEVTQHQNSFKVRLYDPFNQLNRTMFYIPFYREDIQSNLVIEALHDTNCYNGHLRAHVLNELEVVPMYFFTSITGKTGLDPLILHYPEILRAEGPTMDPSTMIHIKLSERTVKAFGSFGDYARSVIDEYPKIAWKHTDSGDQTTLLKEMLTHGSPDNILVLPESLKEEELQFLEHVGIIEKGSADNGTPVPTQFFTNLIKLKEKLGM